ncbi:MULTISPECIES: hypothetical protein [Achromobacter]|uniref:hypothetical protein n=1 Tax=Achromobacter TaxID=222 RepID=UPI001468008B|nr:MULTISPECIES: hypothetical protein [Achromobacter]CAB3643019.1 hypothetical protein LMG26840_02208 [Achromobacter dolens]
MSSEKKDPFDESSWGSLRYSSATAAIVKRARYTMNALGMMFSQEDAASPKFSFVEGGELPSLGKFVTPLGTAEVRLGWRFEPSSRQHDFDDVHGAIAVLVKDSTSSSPQLVPVDWQVDVTQYGAVKALSGGFERVLSDPQGRFSTDMNYYQAGMALYRAIAAAS